LLTTPAEFESKSREHVTKAFALTEGLVFFFSHRVFLQITVDKYGLRKRGYIGMVNSNTARYRQGKQEATNRAEICVLWAAGLPVALAMWRRGYTSGRPRTSCVVPSVLTVSRGGDP